jgi:hypothetical protein
MQGCAILDFVYRIFGRDLFVAVIRVAVAVDLNKRPFLESLDTTPIFTLTRVQS